MLFPTSTECVLQNKAQNSQLCFLTTKPTKPCPLQNKQTNKQIPVLLRPYKASKTHKERFTILLHCHIHSTIFPCHNAQIAALQRVQTQPIDRVCFRLRIEEY